MSTPNLGLSLPVHGALNWDTPLNGNFTDLDSVVGGGTAGQVLTSNGPNTAPTYQPVPPPVLPTQVDNETPVGTINGTNGSDGNAVFALAFAPNPATSLHLTKNGAEIYAGVAFTLTANQIVYTAPYIPITGDLHRATYKH